MKVSYDLFNSGFRENLRDFGGLVFNGALGYAESWCAPLTAPGILKEADKEFDRDKLSVYNLACHGAEAAGYTFGIMSHLNGLLTDPSDWRSWIPVATNLVGRTIGYVYNNYDRISEALSSNENFHVSRHDVRQSSEKPGDSEVKSGESKYYD